MNNAAAASPPPPLSELVLSLEQATILAKQLPAATDPTQLLQIYSSLHRAHLQLSSFLAKAQSSPFLSPPLPQPPFAAAENSLSSTTAAVSADENGNDPMQVGDDDDDDAEAEENSKTITIDKVEERMRDCFIKKKRPKRQLSPSSAAVAEERRLYDDGYGGGIKGYDPYGNRLRALELVYQFHT